MPALDLLVLGDCNPDLLLSGGAVEPAFGQIERVVEEAKLVIGGSGAITACGAARLGLRAGLVAVVGDDTFGRFMQESLAQRGVDVSGIAVDGERPTGVSVVLVRGPDRAILTALGTIPELSAAVVDDEPALLSSARAAGATTSIDPNWDPREEWDGGLLDALADTDVLLVNGEEAKQIAGEDDVEAAAQKLAERGPLVVVKLGEDGAVAVSGASVVRAPAIPLEVVDTVGAGDSFDAGFLAGFLGGRPLEDSLALACACGSLSIRAGGGTDGQPTLAQAMSA